MEWGEQAMKEQVSRTQWRKRGKNSFSHIQLLTWRVKNHMGHF